MLDEARAQLEARHLTNVALHQAFFDARYVGKHDIIFTRFTLQHCSEPQAFVRSVYRSLLPGGMFVALEPIYDYYDSEPPDPVWQDFRRRIFMHYARWGSDPNVPKRACRWLAEAGFTSIRASINMYAPLTIGQDGFAAAILTTALALRFDHADIWDEPFLQRLERWLTSPPCVPYVAIAHLVGSKARWPPGSRRSILGQQALRPQPYLTAAGATRKPPPLTTGCISRR